MRFAPLILALILGALVFLAATGRLECVPLPSYAVFPQQKVLVVHDSSDPGGESAYREISAALHYAKISMESVDLAETSSLPDLTSYSCLVLSTEKIYKLDRSQAERIRRFVQEGGGLAVLYRGWNPYLADLFGFPEGKIPPFSKAHGVEFKCDFQPGIKDEKLGLLTLSPEDEPLISCFDIRPKEAEVIAASSEGIPLIWLRRCGKGRVLYWNADWLAYKRARGLIPQSILCAQGAGGMTIANVGVFYIDDFPCYPPLGWLEPVKSEYGLSGVDFYYKHWYPDIVKLGRKYGIKYSFFVVFNYNAKTEPPFNFEQWKYAKIRLNGQDVPFTIYMAHQIAQHYELGLHGYNHVSLTLKNWKSEDQMVKALRAAREQWIEDGLGDLPLSYVPPHNIYDEHGIKALREAFPSIKVIGGIYLGKFEEGGNREFGPDPWDEEIFDIPRLTEGYFLTPQNRLLLIGGLNMLGVFSHFIHPDDVYDNPVNYPEKARWSWRNPETLPWRGDLNGRKNGLYYHLDELLDFVSRNYPWLRYMFVKDAYKEFERYFDIKASFSFSREELKAVFSDAPVYFQIRLDDGRRINLSELENCQFVHVYEGEGYYLYTFKALRREVRLKFILPM